jgi:hypothetical protein
MARSFVLLAALMAATPALAQESLLTKALSCRIDDGAVAKLMDALAAENAGLKKPAQSLGAPSGNLYRLAAPVSALGYASNEIYVAPGRIALAVAGQGLASVSAKLKLTPDAYGPAERRMDDAHAIIAYQLHQSPLAGKILVGCAYAAPAALGWLGQDGFGF